MARAAVTLTAALNDESYGTDDGGADGKGGGEGSGVE